MRAKAKKTSIIDGITAGYIYDIINSNSKSNTTLCIINKTGVMLRVKKKDFEIINE